MKGYNKANSPTSPPPLQVLEAQWSAARYCFPHCKILFHNKTCWEGWGNVSDTKAPRFILDFQNLNYTGTFCFQSEIYTALAFYEHSMSMEAFGKCVSVQTMQQEHRVYAGVFHGAENGHTTSSHRSLGCRKAITISFTDS